MDEQRLINLRNEYLKNKDTYTPEQQEAMENKFWDLVQRAMAEKDEQAQKEPVQKQQQPIQRYTKVEEKPYRVSL